MSDFKIPNFPDEVSGTTVLSRMIDGLAFRYFYATENLNSEFLQFKPCNTSMNTLEILNHIYRLAKVTDFCLNQKEAEKIESIASFEILRNKTLKIYQKNSAKLKQMSDSELASRTIQFKNKPNSYPFWNLINGPIADAISHVGQLNSWRRIDGNPIPKNNPFTGQS
jgi:hypothetical protein